MPFFLLLHRVGQTMLTDLNLIRETDFYSICHQQQPALLRGHLRRGLTAQEFTQTCETTLAMASAFHCRYWLVDGRTNPAPHRFRSHNWLEEEFLPRALEILGRPPFLAYLLPLHWHELSRWRLLLCSR